MKKLCLAFSFIVLALCVTNACEAFIVIDMSKIMKWEHESTQKLSQYRNIISHYEKRFDLSGTAGNDVVQSETNITANKITRQTANQNLIFNNWLKMAMQPMNGSCSVFNISNEMANYECGLLGHIDQTSQASAEGLMNGSKQNSYGDTEYTYQQTKTLGSLTDKESQAVTNAANFENVNEKTLTPEQAKESRAFVYLVGPKPNLAYDPRLDNTILGDRLKAKRLSQIAKAQAPINVLNSVVLSNESINGGPSVQRMLTQSGQSFVINPKDVLTMNEGDKMTPEAILRQKAILLAYQNYLLVQTYKSNLKKEFLYSNWLVQLQKEHKQ